MAIKKYIATAISDVTAFYNFLINNREGTFLENKEIVIGDDESYTIKIDGWITIRHKINSAFNSGELISIDCGDYTSSLYLVRYSDSDTYGGYFVTEALLCDNGLLMKFACTKDSWNATSYNGMIYGAMITVDNKGELAVVFDRYDQGGSSSTTTWTDESNEGFRAFAKDALGPQRVRLDAYYGAALTTLAPIIPASTDGSTTLPYAFTAVQTQIAATGLTSVVIGSDTYITNGYWYVKD